MKKGLVSFVIRTKNEGRFIGKVLHYVYSQTCKNIEVIVIDSGSRDNTLRIVKKYPVKFIQIKQKEFGMSHALNIGIKESNGEFICILSGHSIPINNTWLEDGLKNFKNNKVAGISGYYSENPIGYYFRPIWRLDFRTHEPKKNYDPWLTNTNSIIRRTFWKKYPFDEKLDGSEDYDWALEMLARGFNIIKDRMFSIFHSHALIGRPGYTQMLPIWEKRNRIIELRKRPRKSYTRTKM